VAKQKQGRVLCIFCKKNRLTEPEQRRKDVCFKCIPEDETITSKKEIYDSDREIMRLVIRTKKLLHRRITDSLFAGEPSIERKVYAHKKYTSK